MAVNPDGTPGAVAAGELVESAWGNAVANSIQELTHRFAVPHVFPAGVTDTGNASLTDWLLTTVPVPVWASNALIVWTLTGFFEPTGMGNGTITLAGRIGTTNGYSHVITGVGENRRMAATWIDAFAVPTGTQAIGIQAARSGSLTLRADTQTKLIMLVVFE